MSTVAPSVAKRRNAALLTISSQNSSRELRHGLVISILSGGWSQHETWLPSPVRRQQFGSTV